MKPGTQVQAKVYASVVELCQEGRCVARHERCYSRQQQVLDLEHYPDVLTRKPGALAGSRPSNSSGVPACGPPASMRSGKRS